TLKSTAARVPLLISYAVGALLGAVFLAILPHLLQQTSSVRQLTTTVLIGILAFFALEKLVLWRHSHAEPLTDLDAHDEAADHGRSGLLILIGDVFHNFVDGILIAGAFVADTGLGIVTAIAIIAHKIPQELGDFLILSRSGYSRTRAIAFNLLCGGATLVGAVLAYVALQMLESWIPTLLAVAAASMIYVAVADLIPGLHKRADLNATLEQVLLIALGIATISALKFFVMPMVS
ncbi:MAG: ZIP family metal transporter, partial [Burkholderiales bacterium]